MKHAVTYELIKKDKKTARQKGSSSHTSRRYSDSRIHAGGDSLGYCKGHEA